MDKVPGKCDLLPVHLAYKTYGTDGMTRRGEDQKFIGAPLVFVIVPKTSLHWNVAGQREEVVPHLVQVEHSTPVPKSFGIFEQVPFVSGGVNGKAVRSRASGALALIAMVMGVQDCVNFCDADLAEQI